MEGPGSLIRRAKRSRMQKGSWQPVQTPRRVPIKSGHGEYSALMRSHDRVSSRHIRGQG